MNELRCLENFGIIKKIKERIDWEEFIRSFRDIGIWVIGRGKILDFFDEF